MVDASKLRKNHLQFAFGCDGGGGCGRRVESKKKTTSDSHLDAREVVVVVDTLKLTKKNHLWLTFGCEGGGGAGTVGVTDVSGRLRKKEWEKTGNNFCHCPFS